MDRATFESQKAFAGEKKASMQRRCVDNDYTAQRMYMITMVTEGRKPLFGQVVGQSEAVEPSPEAPRIALSPLGGAIERIWQTILFVQERMEKPLGKVLLGVKQACNKAFREVMPVEFDVRWTHLFGYWQSVFVGQTVETASAMLKKHQ